MRRITTGETLTITGTDAANFGAILQGATLPGIIIGFFKRDCNGVLPGSPLPVVFSSGGTAGHPLPWLQF